MQNNWKFSAALGISMLLLLRLHAQYTGLINFSQVDVNIELTDGWHIATIAGCYMETDVGKPYLPVKHLHIAIPEDITVVSIEIINIQQQELTGTHNIMPTQPGQIPGKPEPDFVEPDQTIYLTNAQYPNEFIYFSTSGFMSGMHIAGLLYYPLTYNPITKKLYLTTHLEYRLVYANQEDNPVKPRRMAYHSMLKVKGEIEGFVDNPDDVDNLFQLEQVDYINGAIFVPTNEFPNFNGPLVEYVIITNQILAEGFQEIADWKTFKGVPAVVRTVEWIYSNYPGADQAEKVRNFIIDAYQNWGTQYFMLGGDTEQVPVRYAWISHWNNSQLIGEIPNGDFISADMYFACLDGNWNADGDATFGEADWDRQNDGTFEWTQNYNANLDNVDRLPDVVIGRLPAENTEELNRWKIKYFEYVKTSQGNENNVLLFSQDADNVYHESMDNYVAPQFPANISITKLYKDDEYTNTDVLNAFNATDNIKKHIICGFGHGGTTSFNACQGPLNRTDMDNLVNSDRHEILFLNHCESMKWSNNTVAEHFINSINGGVSVIAYSTFGWTSSPLSFNKPFIQNIYNDDYHIGIAFKKIKELYYNNSYKDYTQRMDFFSLSLASDPEMSVWTNSPDPQNPLIVDVPASVYTGHQTISVDINDLAIGVEAVICLFKAGEVYAREILTGAGSPVTANLECTPDTPGDILITVTAKNYLPVETMIPVTANPGSHLYISDHAISGNETIDAGETVDLNIELNNSGLITADNVYAILSTEETYLTLNNANSTFGSINSGASVWGQSVFGFTVSPLLTEDKIALFNLVIHDGNGHIFNDQIHIEIKSPSIAQRSKTIILTTDGDNIIEAGETVSFDIDLFNNSHSLLQNVNAVLGSQSTYVENIQQNQGAYGNIASFETNTNTTEYVFQVSSAYPGEPEPVVFSLDVINEFGQQCGKNGEIDHLNSV